VDVLTAVELLADVCILLDNVVGLKVGQQAIEDGEYEKVQQAM
jgi:hypothetical protein